MSSRLTCRTRSPWWLALVMVATSMLALPAQAVLDSPVNVRLLAPGGTSFGDPAIDEMAVVDTTVGLNAGDVGNLISGFWMLDTEFIHFDGASILLRVRAGDEFGGAGNDLATGYLNSAGPDIARYQISGLNVPGFIITGLMAYSFDSFATSGGPGDSGLVDPAGFHAELVGGQQVDFWLGQLIFRDRGNGTGNAYAEFRIDLTTAPIPEPASWALLLIGLTGVAGLARSRRRVG